VTAASLGAGALALEWVAAATGGQVLRAGPPPTGVSIDSRTVNAGELFVAVAGPRFDGHDFVGEAAARGAAALLVHREVALPPGVGAVRVDDTTLALGRLAREARLLSAAGVVAVTGSVGKTTTKEMAAVLLGGGDAVLRSEGNLNNRYGLPLSLLRLRAGHRYAVVELGMSAAGELRELSRLAAPDVAVITLVAPVHLQFFASLADIAAAKAEVLEGLREGGVAVLNADDPQLRAIGRRHPGRVLWFGREGQAEVSAGSWRAVAPGLRFELDLAGRRVEVALGLTGAHNVTNFLAAAAVAHHFGVGPEEVARRALDVRPARHRGEVLALGEGVSVLDDCYNSNPRAVEAAVLALGTLAAGRRVAFLGDMLELGPTGPELHREAGRKVGGGLDLLVGVGDLAGHFLAGARESSPAPRTEALGDAAAAAAAVPSLVRPGDAVLVKGSRGVRLEQVVEALLSRFGPAGA
jgi:UDP-N-acetylmuramoyl-tripeptide--D-alanyl-D-alanine ligase